MPEQLAQKVCKRPVAGNIQGQTGPGSHHPDLFTDVPAPCRGGWTRQPLKSPSSQWLKFYRSVIP